MEERKYRPEEIPPNKAIQQILDILCRNEQDTKLLLMVLMRAQSLERIKLDSYYRI